MLLVTHSLTIILMCATCATRCDKVRPTPVRRHDEASTACCATLAIGMLRLGWALSARH